MIRISYTYHVTNNTVIQRMQKESEILHSVKVRKMAYLGHVISGEKYQLILDKSVLIIEHFLKI